LKLIEVKGSGIHGNDSHMQLNECRTNSVNATRNLKKLQNGL